MPMTKHSSTRFGRVTILKVFSAIFLPIAFLLCTVLFIMYYSTAISKIKVIKSQETHDVMALQRSFSSVSRSLVSDLKILSALSDLNIFVNTGSKKHLNNMTRDFLAVSRFKGYYDQIRFLDDTGMEVARVNRNNGEPSIVPKGQLQLKVKRYYFKDTLSLSPGQYFISPFDLNIEKGKIERPLKPVIRLGIPILNNHGKKKGVLLLNFLGKSFIENLEHSFYGSHGQTMLLNQDGYWLKGPVAKDEWGFMFKDRLNNTFFRRFPDAWAKISKGESGQFALPDGLFTFTTIYLIPAGIWPNIGSSEPLSSGKQPVVSREYYWKLVSFVPQKFISINVLDFLKNLNVVHGIIFIFIAAGSWVLAQARVNSRKADMEIEESEKKFRSIFETSNDAIMLLNEKGFIDCNNATKIVFGSSSKDEFLGKHPAQWSPETQPDGRDSMELANERMATAFREGRNFFEWTHRRANGEEFHAEVLLTALRLKGKDVLQATVRDISERKKSEKILAHFAHYDALTGLPNRVLLFDRMERALAVAHRAKQHLAVLFLDLDGFKAANDTDGHKAGDAILKEVACRLMKTIRKADNVGRIGGDEFVMTLANIKNTHNVELVISKLLEAIEMPFIYAGHDLWIGASIGISMYPDNALDRDTLVSQADSAMYIAKKEKGNAYHFYAGKV